MILFVVVYPLLEAALPECGISESSENYRGTQWITENGDPCLSWNISSVRKVSLNIGSNKIGQYD